MEAAAAKPVLRVAAICGSLRKASFNRGLLRAGTLPFRFLLCLLLYAKIIHPHLRINPAAAEVCEDSIPGLRIDHLDISDLPIINTDLETEGGGFPPAVEAFRDKVCQADCFLFGAPEYNYSIATPLKNALDWASRGKNCWVDKPAAIVSAGGGFGGGRSQYHLRQVGVFLDLHFINKPELCIQAFQQPPKFDSDGNLIDNQIRERLKQVLLSLQAFTLRLQKD
ncbi:putative NADPH:quinone oxidoreductase 1 [Dichanthelium oligosanthes]|uniref:NAD(P)H dehydrogenase (quinone) n=1 Tax=Dichanthelium oligosanthes TaxID=888268 RepID=A0A1E5WKQ9_9POAL|nr:putative NADPH:quinone oxidoreductase 1 [Dichanthelium oligosanthes]